jgi:DNA-binding winged helix-turn-helix (wHTH) protein/TolB-like protein/Flp pilus assembly protein TadD
MAKSKRYFQFGEFLLDVSERALLREAEPVQLTPKAFDTLLVLLESAGSLVQKDELMRAVWPDSFVEEVGLARNISVLRKALGQDTGGQQFIETVPKRGYRFTAQVREHVDDGAELVFERSSVTQTVEIFGETAIAERARAGLDRAAGLNGSVSALAAGTLTSPLSRNKRVVAALAVSLVAVAALGYFILANRARPFDKSKIKSIAVLPFKRLDTADDSERLGIGMADTLITRLSNIRELSVRSTRDVMKYEDNQQDIAQAGKALGVDAVLDGSIQRAKDRVRVTVRLIHTESNSQIWAAQLDEKLSDIFALQDAISAQVAKSLSLNLSELEQQRIKKNYTSNVEAYQAYLKGRYFWNRRSREDLNKTIEHFEEAIRISPDYALAYAGLADAYSTRANLARTAPKREDGYKLAKEAAAKAIEIDNNLAEAHASLGFILRSSDWDWLESQKALKRAIELNPNYATAHQYYSLLLATLGRMDEAIAEIETAQRLDPLSLVINSDLTLIQIFARRPQQAIETAKKALEIDKHFPRLRRMLMWAYEEAGMLDEALRESQSVQELEGEDPIFKLSILGYGYAVSGQREKAQEMVGKLVALAGQISPALVQAAAVCSGLGDKDRAFELLEKAQALRNDRLLWIKVDPRFDRLREDERYKSLLRSMSLPQ